MDVLVAALALVLDPQVLLVVALSGAFGLFVGAMPGLTATMAVALLVPVTFFMPPVPALAAIVTATTMAIFAGDIPGAMLRMPGTPASAAYVEDSHRMALSGRLNLNLGTNLVASALGGLFGVALLILAAPVLAEFALNFTAFEYFWLAVLGLSCAIFIASGDPLKAAASLLIGLALATVGIDPAAGAPRYTFGAIDLLSGIEFIPAMIGLFALAEVLRGVLRLNDGQGANAAPPASGPLFRGVGGVIARYRLNVLRGASIGALIGALPGAGADIAAWMAYAVSKRFSREPKKFGTGHVEGLVDASAANNASLGAAWIPALVFGIPGDSITAIVIGVLYMKGMNPGPTVFLQNPELIYAVFMIFILAVVVMLPMGWLAVKCARPILRVPRRVLLPLVLMVCVVGAFAITNSWFGVAVMLAMGVVGWIMEENGFPVAPAILGLVLGGMVERMFMSSMIRSAGDLTAFFDRPVAAALGCAVLLLWGWALIGGLRRLRRAPAASLQPEASRRR